MKYLYTRRPRLSQFFVCRLVFKVVFVSVDNGKKVLNSDCSIISRGRSIDNLPECVGANRTAWVKVPE